MPKKKAANPPVKAKPDAKSRSSEGREPQVSRASETGPAGSNRFEPALANSVAPSETLAELESRSAELLAGFENRRFGPRVPAYPRNFARSDADWMRHAAESSAAMLTTANAGDRARAARLAVRLVAFAPVANRIAEGLADPVILQAVCDELDEARRDLTPPPAAERLSPLLPYAVAGLGSTDENIFGRAFGLVFALATVHADIRPTLPQIVECLLSDDLWRRETTIRMLGYFPPKGGLVAFAPRIMDALRKAVETDDPLLGELQESVVCQLGPKARDVAVPVMVELAANRGPLLRYSLGHSLTRVGGRGEGVATLAELLWISDAAWRDDNCDPPVMRRNVAEALKSAGSLGAKVLRRAAADSRAEVRFAAETALAGR